MSPFFSSFAEAIVSQILFRSCVSDMPSISLFLNARTMYGSSGSVAVISYFSEL